LYLAKGKNKPTYNVCQFRIYKRDCISEGELFLT